MARKARPVAPEFSSELKRLREKAGLSVTELAQRLTKTPAAIRHWEAGVREPELGMLPLLAAALGATLSDFLSPSTREQFDRAFDLMVRTYNQLPPGCADTFAADLEHFVQQYEATACAEVEHCVIPAAGWKARQPWQFERSLRQVLDDINQANIKKSTLVVAPTQVENVSQQFRSWIREQTLRVIDQAQQSGPGDAICLASAQLPPQPIAVVFPDDHVSSESIRRMLDLHRDLRCSVVAVRQLESADVRENYGIVTVDREAESLWVNSIVEKPDSAAPSEGDELRVAGGYVLTSEILAALRTIEPNPRTRQREVSDAIAESLATRRVAAVMVDG